MSFEIVSRSGWGARQGDGVGSRPLPCSEAWLHHSVTIAPDLVWVDADGNHVDDDEQRAMLAIESIGTGKFGKAYGFPYTFAVMPSGRIYAGHAIGQLGAHTYGHNTAGIGVVFVGDYTRYNPTPRQLDATAWLLRTCVRRGWLKSPRLTGGHRDTKPTACPGDRAYAAIAEINRRALRPEPTEDNDMRLSDHIDMKGELAGRELGRSSMSVDGALGYGALAKVVLEELRELRREQRAQHAELLAELRASRTG